MHQIVCRTPNPTGGAYSAPPDPLAGLGGGAPRGKGRRREGETEGGEGGSGGKVREGVPECPNPELASVAPGRAGTDFRLLGLCC